MSKWTSIKNMVYRNGERYFCIIPPPLRGSEDVIADAAEVARKLNGYEALRTLVADYQAIVGNTGYSITRDGAQMLYERARKLLNDEPGPDESEPAPVAGEGEIVYPWANYTGVMGSALKEGQRYQLRCGDDTCTILVEYDKRLKKRYVGAITIDKYSSDCTFTPITEPTNET